MENVTHSWQQEFRRMENTSRWMEPNMALSLIMKCGLSDNLWTYTGVIAAIKGEGDYDDPDRFTAKPLKTTYFKKGKTIRIERKIP